MFSFHLGFQPVPVGGTRSTKQVSFPPAYSSIFVSNYYSSQLKVIKETHKGKEVHF